VPVTAAWFAPDGATAVSAGGGEARRWRIDDGITIAALEYRPELRPYFREVGGCEGNPATIAAALVEKDVMLAAATAGEQAEVWSFRTGARLVAVQHQAEEDTLSNRDKLRVAISADGKVLATSNASKDGPVRLWEVPSGRLIQKLSSFESAAASIMQISRWREPVSPDGRYFVDLGDFFGRRAPVIREMSADRPFVELVGQEGINAAAFSPDGRYLVTGAADGTVRLLLWKPEDLAREACRTVVRNLSREEWDTHVGAGNPHEVCPNL
jgi:WD40 repeat protein